MATNVPKLQFTIDGLVLPTESEILTAALADVDAAFGGGMNPSLETPQGQLASSQTAIIGDHNDKFAYFVNQVDPDFAEGTMQDAIGRIYFLDRNPAVATVVSCDCVGTVGTVIPVGAKAQDTSGNLYICLDGGTIPVGGTIALDFTCAETGAIACPSGTLTKIYSSVAGWDTINNPADGTIGRDVESRIDFEFRRRNSVAINSRGSLASIYAAVMAVDGVLDAYCCENYTSAAVDVGSTDYTMVANSIYIAVVGGSNSDIASAILRKKDLGCNMNGNTTVTVSDSENYSYPYPEYIYKFHRPTAVPILFAVSIIDNPTLSANIDTIIKDTIIASFNGQNGTARERIAATIFASKYYAPVSLVSPAISLISILIGTSTATLNQVELGIDQYPTITASNITVTLV